MSRLTTKYDCRTEKDVYGAVTAERDGRPPHKVLWDFWVNEGYVRDVVNREYSAEHLASMHPEEDEARSAEPRAETTTLATDQHLEVLAFLLGQRVAREPRVAQFRSEHLG